ncbi:MAG: S41 family peptidase [Acidimicrobiia bacterium]
MSQLRRFTAVAALFVLLASCNGGGEAEPDATAATATSQSATGSMGTIAGDRPLRLVGCDPSDPEVEIVCEAYDLIRRHYVDQISDAQLARAANQGLRDLDGAETDSELVCAAPAVAFQESCELALGEADTGVEAAEAMVYGLTTYGLDPNSVYFDPEALELIEEEQTGEIQGIGALVTAEDSSSGELCPVISETCTMYIISTIDGTPADTAGLQPDDVVIAVDGDSILGWTIDEVTATVRGPAGTDVVLTIDRDDEVFDVTITRAAFVVPAVASEVVGDAGYVALNLFTDNADELFADAVQDLLDQGVEALVVDLRNNPGGLLDTAIEVASAFLPDGEVVVTESPDSSTSYPVSGDPIVPQDMKVVVVVNQGSASASEVVSAVLQERGRVTVVGENTFGKNTVQQRFALSNGGALKLTIARWLTPGGLDFGSVGVTPDVRKDIETELSVEAVVREALAASVTVAA